ncbi:MAG: hypothetical protein RLZZ214_3235 [Verrucomicrobiota bacterium]|jgi:hypothetical protein
MNNAYSIVKILFASEAASASDRQDNQSFSECMQAATPTRSGVGCSSFAGYRRPPQLRRRAIYGHDHLVFMKSQLG